MKSNIENTNSELLSHMALLLKDGWGPWMASSRSLSEMQTPRPLPRLTKSEGAFLEVWQWFTCTLTFEKHWFVSFKDITSLASITPDHLVSPPLLDFIKLNSNKDGNYWISILLLAEATNHFHTTPDNTRTNIFRGKFLIQYLENKFAFIVSYQNLWMILHKT